jgi:hypothetical protein
MNDGFPPVLQMAPSVSSMVAYSLFGYFIGFYYSVRCEMAQDGTIWCEIRSARDGFGAIWCDMARYDINTFLDVSEYIDA